MQASQSSKETCSREAIGADSSRFANALLCSGSVHTRHEAGPEEDPNHDEADGGKKAKEKKAPLAERLLDLSGTCRASLESGVLVGNQFEWL